MTRNDYHDWTEMALKPDGRYTTTQVGWLTGLTTKQIRYWRDTGLVEPCQRSHTMGRSDEYCAEDVARLRVLAAANRKLSVQQIRKRLDIVDQDVSMEEALGMPEFSSREAMYGGLG